MSKMVFISYCHAQGEWVLDRLVPALRAGGADVHIDRERFTAGRAVVGQMDATQDAAEMSVLVLSPDYLASRYCLHEMDRAIRRDPQFQYGIVIPVIRVACNLPAKLRTTDPLYVNLCDDKEIRQWDSLLQACGANLGAPAPDWLSARDEIRRFLGRHESVNLVISGDPKWRELIEHIRTDYMSDLGMVDLQSGATASRRGLVAEILKACGTPTSVPPEPEDLVILNRIVSARSISRLVLEHFDLIANRHQYYDIELFAALRYMLMESRKLVLLIQSRTPFAALLPQDHTLSSITIYTVGLRGR